MNKRNLFSVLAIFLWQTSFTQSVLKDQAAINAHADAVMLQMEKKDFPATFELLKKYWPVPDTELRELEAQTTKQFDIVDTRFGKVIGTTFFKDQQIKDFLIRKIYVLRFEKHLLRLMFTYYRNNDGWTLNSFKWDDQASEMFEMME